MCPKGLVLYYTISRIQYIGKYMDKKMSRSKRIDTVMDILQVHL